MLIYYCDICSVRIPAADFEANTAIQIDESRALCAGCAANQAGKVDASATAAAQVPARIPSGSNKSRTAMRPATGSATLPQLAEARTSKGHLRTSHPPAFAPAPQVAVNRRQMMVLIGASGLVLIVSALILIFGSHGTAADKKMAASESTSRTQPSVQPSTPSPTPIVRTHDVVKPEVPRATDVKTVKPTPPVASTPAKTIIENAPPAPDTPPNPLERATPPVAVEKPAPVAEPAPVETAPAPLAKPELPPGTQELDLGNASSVCKLLWSDFKGGGEYHGFAGKDKASKAIWGKNSTRHTMIATFELKPDLYDAGTIVVWSLFEGKKPSSHIVFAINGQEAFNGNDTATQMYVWTEQRYPLAAGLLKGGKNEFRISNLNETAMEHEFWYMIHSVEIIARTRHAFAPVVSEVQRVAIRTCDSVEEMMKKDFDPAQKLEQALRITKGSSAPELQLLGTVLEKAQALHSRALENLAKSPPAEDVQIEKPKMRGKIARITDGKVYVKSQGVELAVDLSALPQSVFVKALGVDESKPAEAADKAAYLFGLGNSEGAQQLLRRLKKDEVPAWAAYVDARATQKRLLKFEAAVNDLETALKNGRAGSVSSTLETLKKDYPDLSEANAERLRYLATVAEQLVK